MQCPSVISYPPDVPCPVPLPFSDLFIHVCDLGLFSYQDICFLSRYVIKDIIASQRYATPRDNV